MAFEDKQETAALRVEWSEWARLSGVADDAENYQRWLEHELIITRRALLELQVELTG
jgi:hypothetical protein